MGTLYVIGTPIGNLEDITLRALRLLREVDLVAAEDTRKARQLLQHYGIEKPMTSFFAGNEHRKKARLLTALAAGDVALISEAGMPGISDPGYLLVRAALDHGYPVVAIPGPSAHTAALVVSGLPSDRFIFLGFLPRRGGERRATLEQVAASPLTLVLYEAPHRLAATLRDMREVLGDRPIALCRELTKRFEEVWRGTIDDALRHLAEHAPRGEYTLVVGGAPAPERWPEERVRQALAERLAAGLGPSQAAREVAALSGWPRRRLYTLTMEEEERRE